MFGELVELCDASFQERHPLSSLSESLDVALAYGAG